MAISIDWAAAVIFVPKADTTFVSATPNEVRQLNLYDFRLALRDLEDSEEGIHFPTTHNHNTSVLLGGVEYARVIEILPPYTVTFEDGMYAVNLLGANSNVADRINVNQVSVRSFNSAGLTVPLNATDIADAVWLHSDASALLSSVSLAEVILRNKMITDPVTGLMTIYASDGVTPLLTAQLHEDAAGTQTYRGQGAERRARLEAP